MWQSIWAAGRMLVVDETGDLKKGIQCRSTLTLADE
jgi:hypothetical protein